MATNGLEMPVDHIPAFGPLEKSLERKRVLDNRTPEADHARTEGGAEPSDAAHDFVLAPLVDKIAYGIARGLVVAVKELEQHIASETRKVGEAVDRRLDTLQSGMEELSRFVAEQRATNITVHGRLEELSGGLRETDARQSAAVDSLRTETTSFAASATQRIDAAVAAQRESDARRETEMALLSQSLSERIETLCRELGVQQEDLSAIKLALGTFSTRVDGLVERLDRQGEAVRSMYAAYSQRETELEQLVDGLARLRAFPAPMPSNAL
jgi:chromosome segregation ATPase